MHRIALRCLFLDRGRLAAALTGVCVATVLMLVQAGIYFGFAANASALVRRVGGDVWVVAAGTRHVDQGDVLGPGVRERLESDPCVRRVRPLVFAWVPFREASGAIDSLQVIGVPGEGPAGLLPWSFARGTPADLRAPMRVSVDLTDLDILDASGASVIGAALEIAGRTVRVGALTRGIRNVALTPMIFCSPETARAIVGLGAGESTYWIADLESPTCAASLVAAIGQQPELDAFTAEGFAESTEQQFLEDSGVGAVLAFVAALGLVIAIVIVGQTLLSSLHQNRQELAMLKVLGATRRELVGFVVWQALFLALVGTGAGTLAALVVARLLEGLAIPVVLPPSVTLGGVVVMLALCALASAASVRAVLRLQAAEVLQ